jgi:lipopolysaccharide/colanic/teichoic acid biosynthesis glycosyltransferase
MTSIDFSVAVGGTRPSLSSLAHTAHAPDERGRRALNVVVAAFGIIVASPVFALVALAVRLTSRGPVIYRQTRVGIDRRRHMGGNHRRTSDAGGLPFTMYKFRTMTVSAPNAAEQWAEQNDARVTPVGRVLRKFRLDELPQLFNVLLGDMNVVGPRPEQPTILASLREQIPGYAIRQRVRPGITGWAQINQHYDTCVDDVKRKVNYDLEYVARQSLAEDLKIMLRTVPTVALRRGGW